MLEWYLLTYCSTIALQKELPLKTYIFTYMNSTAKCSSQGGATRKKQVHLSLLSCSGNPRSQASIKRFQANVSSPCDSVLRKSEGLKPVTTFCPQYAHCLHPENSPLSTPGLLQPIHFQISSSIYF